MRVQTADHCDKCGQAKTSAFMTLGSKPYHGGIYLCRPCWASELEYRRKRNREVWDPFDLPAWPLNETEAKA